ARVTSTGVGTFPVDVNVDAAGRRDALSGAGWDVANADGSDVSSACYYTQRGELAGHELHLHGVVLFANETAFFGAPVTTVADLKTGDVTWTFAAFPPFSGQGVVTKID